MELPKTVQKLIDELSKLPGIGPKSAARLTFYLLTKPKESISSLGDAFLSLSEGLHYCSTCFNICDDAGECRICASPKRDHSIIAVVEEPLDVLALEKAFGFDGVYHVLGGAISPINGVGPQDLRISQLIIRLDESVKEIILATNPNLEGEATAAYIKEKILEKYSSIKITRIARGLPIGGDLEYADEVTLKRSLEGRREY